MNNSHKREADAAGLTMLCGGKSSHYRLYIFNNCGHKQEIALSCVRDKNFRCRACLDDKLISEAAKAGLKLIGPGRSNQYRLYQFNSCGHKQELKTGHVRDDNFKCHICFKEKLNSEAGRVGLKLIGPGRNNAYRTYQFNSCGHKQEITTGHVKDKSFRCQACLDEKLAYEAARVDLKLIGSLKNCLYRLYQFNSCGHKQEITIWHVRNDNFRCQACLDDKLISEAAKAGLKLIGPGRSNQYRLYQFNSCGHKQELKTGHVRDNVFICNQCEDTAMTLPSTVYLIEVNYGSKAWLKLGYSKDIRHRIKGFGLPKTAHIAVLAVRPFDTGKEARRFEGGIHKKFFDEQLDMKQLHSISGGTECYPLLLKQRLLSII